MAASLSTAAEGLVMAIDKKNKPTNTHDGLNRRYFKNTSGYCVSVFLKGIY